MLPAPFQNALVLTGPTGSGKTRLGLDLAEVSGAEIISMDSMALYRKMDIGTAKPSIEEQNRVPHHLINERDPWESANVAWWLQRARECCGDIERRGKRVLLVGGTPLYLKALCCGLFDGPPSDAALRKRLSRDAEEVGPEAMHRRLAAVDPLSAARLHINDVRRVVRALEVWELTQKPLSSFQTQWPAASAPAEFNKAVRIIWLDLPRSELYKRIDDRVLAMFRAGFLEEVAALRALPQPLSREASQALGYKETLDYLDGRMPLDQTIALIKQRTRNFAKRQITWFRHLPGCVPATEQLTRTLWKSTI